MANMFSSLNLLSNFTTILLVITWQNYQNQFKTFLTLFLTDIAPNPQPIFPYHTFRVIFLLLFKYNCFHFPTTTFPTLRTPTSHP